MELKSLYFNLAHDFFLFGAKNWVYIKKKHIQSGAENSISILHDHNKTVISFLSRVPRAVSKVSMRVYKSTVAYKLALQ